MDSYKKTGSKIILAGKGMAMGAADIVPGVSGGTVALISGIYEHLITAISSVGVKHVLAALKLPLVIWSKEKRRPVLSVLAEVPWNFLIPLLIGIATGILSMSRIIPFFMENYPFETFSVFFGLIAFSILIPYKMMKHRVREFGLLIVFAIATFFLTGINTVGGLKVTITPQPGEIPELQEQSGPGEKNTPERIAVLTDEKGKAEAVLQPGTYTVSVTERYPSSFTVTIPEKAGEDPEYTEEAGNKLAISARTKESESGRIRFEATFATKAGQNYAYLFFSGAIAICAMILPGLSGAYLLVILGQYRNILEAIHQREFMIIGIFIAGMLAGILSFVRFLKYLLTNHKSFTMAALTGILIGSLRKIWPFQYTDSYDAKSIAIAAGFALAGAFILYLLERFSIKAHDPEPPIPEENLKN